MAAVGATGPAINMIVNVFLGLSTAAGVLEARAIGRADAKEASRTAHTSIAVSLVCGTVLAVAGVTIATVISQIVSAFRVLRHLLRNTRLFGSERKKLRIHTDILGALVRIGIPAGFQSTFISISNVIVQTSVNRCGDTAMAASSAATVRKESFTSLYMPFRKRPSPLQAKTTVSEIINASAKAFGRCLRSRLLSDLFIHSASFVRLHFCYECSAIRRS